ncbi:hypothetical protein GCM10010508_45760 [Streptomyces naganishii JCM 4654]|uniref:Uncharacterized protein n=1 Tax=Streptomyces naganishii JCM 4654 TaxID=1306179 RepID=A0A919CWN9_9ACTN|nr:hypothetical protein GCM10010508_45760 [Streptomyces naganishii JCM 4654]
MPEGAEDAGAHLWAAGAEAGARPGPAAPPSGRETAHTTAAASARTHATAVSDRRLPLPRHWPMSRQTAGGSLRLRQDFGHSFQAMW